MLSHLGENVSIHNVHINTIINKNNINHAHRAAVTAVEVSKPDTLKQAEAFKALGDIHFGRQNWQGAQEQYERAIAILESKASRSKKLADVYYQIGCAQCFNRQYSQGCHFLQRAIDIYELKWPTPINLAHAYMKLGKYSFGACSAEDCSHKLVNAMRIFRRKGLPQSSTELYECYRLLGEYLVMTGCADTSGATALDCFKNALKVQQLQQQPPQPQQQEIGSSIRLADTCSYIAVLLHKMGDVSQARKYYEHTLEMIRHADDPDVIDLAVVYRQLAEYSHQRGERQLECRYYLKAMDLDHQKSAAVVYLPEDYFNLGWLCEQQQQQDDEDGGNGGGRRNAALHYYEKSMEVFVLCSGWPRFCSNYYLEDASSAAAAFAAANACYCLGAAAERIGDYNVSLTHFQNALSIHEALGPHRVDAYRCRWNARPSMPTMEQIRFKVDLNPSRLLMSMADNTMVPFVWCCALAKLQDNVQSIYFILREQPNLVK